MINAYKKNDLVIFWITLLALIGANYFIPAVAKIHISPNYHEWITENDLSVHAAFAYGRGWLSFLSEPTHQSILSFYEKYSVGICVATMVIELGALFLLANRLFAITFLLLFCCFHLGVFFESGIFFWKWISFNVALAVCLMVFKNSFNKRLFTTRNFAASVFLIVFSLYLFNPVQLGWWDYRYKNEFVYSVEDNQGRGFRISGSQLKPYEQVFTFQRLFFLVPDTVPVINYFKLGYAGFNYLNRVTNVDSVKAFLRQSTYKPYNATKVAQFDHFCQKYFMAKNNAIAQHNVLKQLDITPEHIWTTKFLKNQYPGNVPIRKFRIDFRQYYCGNKKLYLLSSNTVFEKTINSN